MQTHCSQEELFAWQPFLSIHGLYTLSDRKMAREIFFHVVEWNVNTLQ
jgi:hypothetical protein